MSIASLGIVAGLAGTQLPQRAADAERVQQSAAEQSRAAEGAQRAESAAGIGETEEDSQASERDADGRRLWEQQQALAKDPATLEANQDSSALRSKDPTGDSGGQLDVVG
jgi:hypothetical protein